MSNLLKDAGKLNSWLTENVSIKGNAFYIDKGRMSQSVVVDSKSKSEKYILKFNCIEAFNNSFILINTTGDLEEKTYMIPITYQGAQQIAIESGKIDTFTFSIVGHLTIRDIALESYFEGLTEDEKQTLIKVDTDSEEWNKIKDITDDTGNVVAQKINGMMFLNLVNIANSTGQFIQNDNGMMWVSKDNRFASLWNDTGIYFSNSKDATGAWIWQNAIGVNGVVATNIVAGAIDGQKINGAEIIAGTITGGTIKGAVFDGGTTQAGTIKGSTIESSTIKSGSSTGISGVMSPTEPLAFYHNQQNYKTLEFYIREGSGRASLVFYGRTGIELIVMDSLGIEYAESLNIDTREKLQVIGRKDLSIRTLPYYSNTPTLNAQNEWFYASASGSEKYCVVGNGFGNTYIDGLVSAYNLQSRVLSENDVRIMELEEENKNLQNQLVELELRLIEKGVL